MFDFSFLVYQREKLQALAFPVQVNEGKSYYSATNITVEAQSVFVLFEYSPERVCIILTEVLSSQIEFK